MSKEVKFNYGNFKLLNSDVNINYKNFVGYDDSDFDTVNELNSTHSINIAVKDSIYINNSAYIGHELCNLEQKISNENTLNVNGNSDLNGNVVINKKLFVKDNSFFNNNMFINNSLILEEENLSENIMINDTCLTISTYKLLLKNILETTKNSSELNFGSIKFINSNSIITQCILSINKKFIVNENIINCFLLTYILYNKNIIIDVRPIMDTFILLDNNNKIYKLIDNE